MRKKHPHVAIQKFTLEAADAGGHRFADDAIVGDLRECRALAVVPACWKRIFRSVDISSFDPEGEDDLEFEEVPPARSRQKNS